ncbi:MAG: PIG-L family deacetylase [Flavobacteriaceae bacterium]|nr:PIG-L family deacetylase [Flavobacteriaceae bacterium]
MKKVLVVAIHPDDETLGCGGTLLKHKESGDEIHWLIATEMTVEHGFKESVVRKRKEEIQKVNRLYNFDSINRLGFPTTKIDNNDISFLVNKISKIFNQIKPDTVYLPFKSDVHSDHRCFFNAAFSCTKSFRYPFIKRVYMMETLSETEFAPSTKEDSFIPNIFIDISDYIDKKIDIMKVFESEIGDHPFPRSVRNIKALATFRGASSNCNYAESFMLLKEIR